MYRTPEEAETAFYAALEAADLAGMMAVWDEEHDIVCIHPMGSRLQGRGDVQESWQRIFTKGARMRFRNSDVHAEVAESLAMHVVQENITVAGREGESLVVATNVYRRTRHGWRMILHHASPAPASPSEDKPTVLH